jgi:hypothetical protein
VKDAYGWLYYYQAAARAYLQLALTLRNQGIAEPSERFNYRALIMRRKALLCQIFHLLAILFFVRDDLPPEEQRYQRVWPRLRLIFLPIVRQTGSYLFSWFLAALTGYGYRMWRIILAYTLVVLAFAAAYWGLGFQAPPGLNFLQAIIVSVTAFHGRVFSNPYTLTEPQIIFTALEAICGLVIEGLFVAMLVQRFFNR